MSLVHLLEKNYDHTTQKLNCRFSEDMIEKVLDFALEQYEYERIKWEKKITSDDYRFLLTSRQSKESREEGSNNSKKKEKNTNKINSDDHNSNLTSLSLAENDAYDVVEYDTPKLVELEINSGPGLTFQGDCDNVSVSMCNSASMSGASQPNQLSNSNVSSSYSLVSNQRGLLVVGDIHGSLRSLFNIMQMITEHLQINDSTPSYYRMNDAPNVNRRGCSGKSSHTPNDSSGQGSCYCCCYCCYVYSVH
jgi:hypothetical protein